VKNKKKGGWGRGKTLWQLKKIWSPWERPKGWANSKSFQALFEQPTFNHAQMKDHGT